jgi:uncharacterized membrane protein HdeD (DUF308 family)
MVRGDAEVYFSTKGNEVFRGRGLVVLVRGMIAVAFGVLGLLAGRRVSLTTLVLLFGTYAVVHGILSITAAIGGRGQRGCLLLGIEGVVGLLVGATTLCSSQPAPVVFAFFVWLWAIPTGTLRIAEAIRLRKEIPGDVWLALSGVATVFLGLMLFSGRIVNGVVGLALLIAIPAVIWGIFEILLGWELRVSSPRRA